MLPDGGLAAVGAHQQREGQPLLLLPLLTVLLLVLLPVLLVVLLLLVLLVVVAHDRSAVLDAPADNEKTRRQESAWPRKSSALSGPLYTHARHSYLLTDPAS